MRPFLRSAKPAVPHGFLVFLIALCAPNTWSQTSLPTQTMTAKIGGFRDGFLWILNAQGNGVYQPGVDHVAGYGGLPGDYPITGNWSGASCAQGCFNLGIYRPSTQHFLLDTNGDTLVGYGDQYFTLAIPNLQSTDIPLAGDWNGDGRTKVGLFRPSTCEWFLDYDGNGVWNPAIDKHYMFGDCSQDVPVVGDWSGSGSTKIGVYRQPLSQWILDYNGNGVSDAGDLAFTYLNVRSNPALPVVGNWYGGPVAQVGIVYNGYFWILDATGTEQYGPGHLQLPYGWNTSPYDVPVVGNWTQNVPPANASPTYFNIVTQNGASQGSSYSAVPGTQVQYSFTFHDQVNGAQAINSGQVYLANTDNDGVQNCYFQWGVGVPTRLLDNNTSSDAFCTLAGSSLTYSSTDPSAVTLTLYVTFTTAAIGSYTVNSIVYDTLGSTTSWGQVGTYNVMATPLNLSDNGSMVTSAYIAVLGRDPAESEWLGLGQHAEPWQRDLRRDD